MISRQIHNKDILSIGARAIKINYNIYKVQYMTYIFIKGASH